MIRASLFWCALCILVLPVALASGQSASDAAFDLRDFHGDGTTDYVTSVKNQSWGTCWIHATMASMETDLVRSGAWAAAGLSGEADLAEYHLDKYNGFTRRGVSDDEPDSSWYTGQKDPYPGSNVDEPADSRDHGLIVHLGGDYRIAAVYLTTHGAVNETDSTRIDSGTYPQRRLKFGYLDDDGIKKVDDYTYFLPGQIEFLTWQGTDEEKRQRIKESLVAHGGVATCMYYSGSFISGENHYQPALDTNEPNHAVTIIGWDDSRATQAPTRGAWLCKNSWGASYHGGDGCFWISYEDKHAARHSTMGGAAFWDIQPKTVDVVHNHALHGWQYETTAAADIAEVANRFVADDGEVVTSVGLYTLAEGVSYTVRIVSSLDADAAPLASQSGTIAQPGFHAIDLDRPAALDRGETFYVALSLSEGGYAVDASFRVTTAMGTVTDPPYDVYSAAGREESYYRDESGVWGDFLDYDAAEKLGLAWDDDSWNFALMAYGVTTLPGDANLDHVVNDLDASILAAHWQGSGLGWREGDFNGDGRVSDLDASILAANWQGQGAAVPEPGSLALLVGLVSFFLSGSFRRGSDRRQPAGRRP